MSGPVRVCGTDGAGSGVRVNVRFLAYWSSGRFMEPLLTHSAARSQSGPAARFDAITPPSQEQGRAVITSASGYHAGPRFIGIDAIAPTVLNARPMKPMIHACRIGL